MSTDESDFHELLERARAGDRAAWARLFDRVANDEAEGAALHAMARRVLPRSDRARDFVDSLDLLQSALKDGWLDASRFEGSNEREFYAWMRTIIRRKLSRATRRRRPAIGLETGEVAEAGGRSGSSEGLGELIRSEERERLMGAIRALPDDQRAVLTLRLKGRSAPEIAELLSLSPEAVRKRESRAAAQLRKILLVDE